MAVIEFHTDAIKAVSSRVDRYAQQTWDEIWDGLQATLQPLIGDSLDAYTGNSLDDRRAHYQAAYRQYSTQLTSQARSVRLIAQLTADASADIARVLSV